MLGSSFNNGWIGLSPIETLVQRACEPSLGEPPYNLHIELAEYVNNKKANTPRETAHAILRSINSRNPHISLLALSLLNSLVQQCGYPFHLQISTKEFLNELVKRFPERPPPFPGPVMSKILELVNDWKEGICTESRWKDDLGNIRDMWRLLSFKGYRFKERRKDPVTATASTSTLKSAEELENEDRTAQEAKLQELIRRGTPRDLAAAQDLMKLLAGANPDSKPNYKAQALLELSKLESKVILMNELLDNVRTGSDTSSPGGAEKFAKGDVYDQVSQILSGARPKIQKWIADAQNSTDSGGDGDPESLDTFLQINDQINSVLNRYESYKKGDFSIGAVPVELSGVSTGVGTTARSDLIDLDLESSSATVTNPTSATDDLMGLFSGSPATQPQQQPQQAHQPINLDALYSSGGGFSGLTATPTPLPGASGMISANNMTGSGTWSGGGGIVLPSTPIPSTFGSPTTANGTGNAAGGNAIGGGNGNVNAGKAKDPFADLAGLF